MRAPVVLVALTLTVAILVAASLLIFAGTRKTSGHSTLNLPSSAIRARMSGARGEAAQKRDDFSEHPSKAWRCCVTAS